MQATSVSLRRNSTTKKWLSSKCLRLVSYTHSCPQRVATRVAKRDRQGAEPTENIPPGITISRKRCFKRNVGKGCRAFERVSPLSESSSVLSVTASFRVLMPRRWSTGTVRRSVAPPGLNRAFLQTCSVAVRKPKGWICHSADGRKPRRAPVDLAH